MTHMSRDKRATWIRIKKHRLTITATSPQQCMFFSNSAVFHSRAHSHEVLCCELLCSRWKAARLGTARFGVVRRMEHIPAWGHRIACGCFGSKFWKWKFQFLNVALDAKLLSMHDLKKINTSVPLENYSYWPGTESSGNAVHWLSRPPFDKSTLRRVPSDVMI